MQMLPKGLLRGSSSVHVTVREWGGILASDLG